MISSHPLRGRALLGAIFTTLCFFLFNLPNTSTLAQGDDIAALCIAEVINFPDGATDDPCDDTKLVTSNVTIIRATADLPADLSPFEVILISRSPNIFYNPIASRVNDYVSNGGGLLLAFTNFESETNPLPSGFEFTIANDFWPEFPNDPGPIEFTAAGLTHPVNEGVDVNTLVGTIRSIPISSLGSSWELLAKAKNHPNAALAVGEHGAGRIILLELGVNDATPEGLAYASQMLGWLAGESTPPPPGPDMQIDAIEVTQAIQDLNNSVDLIAGKRTFVRVHVSAPEQVNGVSAQLTATKNATTLPQTLMPINDGGTIAIQPEPDRAQLNDSFLFELPIEWTDTGNLRLTAEIDPENSKLDPDRLTNTAGVQVEFIPSDPLKLVLINVGYRGEDGMVVADEFQLDRIEAWLKKAYPISSLESTRRTTTTWLSGAPNTRTVVYRLALLRSILETYSDIPSDVYFYGAMQTDPASNSVGGIALPLYGVAVGHTGDPGRFNDMSWDQDGSYGDWFAGHEIGHLLGRQHADCETAQPADSVPFPYESGKISGESSGDSAFYGFDIENQTIYEGDWSDIMTYCEPKWISDFTYEGIYAGLNGSGKLKSAASPGIAADEFLIFSGLVDLNTQTVNEFEVQQIAHSTIRPLPAPGGWTVLLLDGSNSELASYPIAPIPLPVEENSDEQIAFFTGTVPAAEGVSKIEIRHGSELIATKSASPAPPTVSITSPTTGQTVDQNEVAFSWEGSDEDGDSLTYMVLYSHSGASDWEVIATDLVTPSLTLDTSTLPGGTTSYLRILASDGFYTTEATAGPFTVPSADPKPKISSPLSDDVYFSTGQLISFAGSAHDLEDGPLSGNSLSWSSNIDGMIGTGELAQTDSLSAGVHTITLTATDSDSQMGQTTRVITVLNSSESAPNSLSVAPFTVNLVMATAETVPARSRLTIRNSGNESLNWTASTDVAWLSIDQTAGATPSELMLTVDSNGLTAGSYSGTVTIESAGATPVNVPVFLQVSDTALPTFIWNAFLPTVAK